MEATKAAMSAIERALSSRSYDVTNELRVHAQIDLALNAAGIAYEREAVLDTRSRIDFLVGGVGVEVKVDGSTPAILRQAARYIEHERIRALVLVTTRARHAQALRSALPALDASVPCSVVLLRGAL